MDTVHLGLLGGGSWGNQFADALQTLPDIRLVAVADPDIRRAAAIADRFPACQALAEAQALCQMSDIDAVLVVTPTPTHYDLTCMALQAGKDVLVEKPFALTLPQALEMIKLAEYHDRRLMVGQNMRWMPAVQEMRQRIQNGDIGKPLHVVERRFGAFRSAAWPDWWIAMRGFLLLHLGAHSVDAILWSLNRQPQWAFAQGFARRVDPTHGAIDAFSLTLGLEGEILVGIHHEVFGKKSGLVYHLSIIGETGTMELDDFTTLRLDGETIFHQQELPFPPSLKAELIEFVTAIQENRSPIVSGRDVLPTVSSLDAARRSLDNGQKEVIIHG